MPIAVWHTCLLAEGPSGQAAAAPRPPGPHPALAHSKATWPLTIITPTSKGSCVGSLGHSVGLHDTLFLMNSVSA